MSRKQRLSASLAAAIGALAILALPSAAAAKDRNHDRIPDRWEKRHHLSLAVNQAKRDQDQDGLDNRAEFMAGDNPRDADTDNDGIPDGEENAGKVASFDAETGMLTIDLFGGESIAGTVTEETEVQCEDGGAASSSDSNDGADNSGTQQDQEGQEDQGQAEDQTGCTTEDLVTGAIVHQAELNVVNGMATFEEIELAG
jgi:hypothetical protein